MNEPTLHFSLRSLFTATTLIAILLGTLAVHPVILIASLVMLSPFLFVAAAAVCSRYPFGAKRLFLAIIGTLLVLFGTQSIFMAAQYPMASLVPGATIVALGAGFYIWAWSARTS